MPVPQSGATLPTTRGESFAIGRVLGTGGMGTVVEAVHAPSGRRVALEFLHDELVHHPTIPKRFAREVELATSLSTAHVARTFGVERTPDGTTFMIMELLDGHDLCRTMRNEGRLSPERAARIVSQACEALEEAHARGIVHRDLKPENLFISRAADGSDWVKVLDFGISKTMNDGGAAGPKLTRVGTTVGTPEYMAPEQLRGAKDLDAAADVYSLGVVLYEALTGKRPFLAEKYEDLVRKILTEDPVPIARARPDLPPMLLDVITRAMARDRKHRIATARHLRESLTPFASSGRRSEGTVVMEPSPNSTSVPSAPMAQVPQGSSSPHVPHSYPAHSHPQHLHSAPPMAPSIQPGNAPALTRSDTRSDTRADSTDEHVAAGGGKGGLIAILVAIGLLLAVGAVAIFAPNIFGL